MCEVCLVCIPVVKEQEVILKSKLTEGLFAFEFPWLQCVWDCFTQIHVLMSAGLDFFTYAFTFILLNRNSRLDHNF